MILYYFKLAIRYLKKDRLYAFINLAGLSIAFACCIVIFLFVFSEFGFDRIHKNEKNIYRLTTQEVSEGNKRSFAHSFIPMTPLLQAQFPEVEEIVRLLPYSISVANKERNIVVQEDRFFLADSNLFRVFSFELKTGNSKTVLNDPTNILITEEIAIRYFGKDDPIGKQLLLNNKTIYKVAGVFKKLPSNSSIQFDLVAPFSSAKGLIGDWVGNNSWHYPPVYTFMLLNEPVLASFEKGLKDFEKKALPENLKKTRTHSLQPLDEVHFSSLENELAPGSDKKTLYIFIAIAILILIIAGTNFINLFLSRILYRLRGVGIRKIVGANNRDIWSQTIVEIFSFLLISLVLALLLVELSLPSFNEKLNIQLRLFNNNNTIWIIMGLIIFLTSIIMGIFPAVLLSRFKILKIFKKENANLFSKRRALFLQSFFVIFQFIITIALIVSAITIQSQLHYIQTKDLGLRKNQTLIIPIRDEKIQENLKAIKNELNRVSGVMGVSAISNFPWAKGFYDFNTTINYKGKITESNAYTLLVENDLLSTMGMQMKTGRSFSKELSMDDSTAFIMNETAAKKFGIDSYQGVKLIMNDVASGNPKKGELIGIVKDFHLESLHQAIQPLIITVAPESYYLDNFVLDLSSESLSQTLEQLKAVFKRISKDLPFDYFFLDEAFDKLYKKESKLASLFSYFSILAIIISCLGLLGISAFASVQRTKEIGIRKVLGATENNIIIMLSKDFVKLVLLANIIAFPVSWWAMNEWLQNFSYRINLQPWMFLIAGLVVLTVSLLTVSFQALKAAIANPAKSLRTE